MSIKVLLETPFSLVYGPFALNDRNNGHHRVRGLLNFKIHSFHLLQQRDQIIVEFGSFAVRGVVCSFCDLCPGCRVMMSEYISVRSPSRALRQLMRLFMHRRTQKTCSLYFTKRSCHSAMCWWISSDTCIVFWIHVGPRVLLSTTYNCPVR